MNHIYRLCWNRSLSQWVPASELAHSKRGGATRRHVVGQRVMMLSLLSASLGMTGLAHAANAPTGGQVVGGSGQILQSANTTTIRQNSQSLSLNWQSFDIGADQTVNFVQPGASSVAVNRVLGNTASEIFGHLNANGQVWLINPNGVLFGQGAQVNVGGIVASTLDIDEGTAGSGTVRLAGDGKGKVVNQGSINAASGGYVALIGNQVSNQGSIRAQLGTVALGGGSAVTLTFSDNHLLHLQVDKSTLNNLAENRQLIVADGGQVLMTAGARDSLLASAVNNTGTVQAHSVVDHDGVITLLGGMEAGSVNVGGTLDASAPNGGNGGKIETSAAHFNLAADAKITASAPAGKAGTWLVDPTDLTIDTAAASTISTTLNGGTNVVEQTTSGAASGVGVQSSGNGDINVNAAITWNNAAATLELDAFHDINVNNTINGAGGIVMNATGGTLTIGNAGGLSAGTGATLNANRFTNNAGLNALGAKWNLYTANPSGNALGGITPNFIQYGTSLGGSLLGSGNGLIYSTAASLQITGLSGTVSKVYDNTNAASFTGGNFVAGGLLNGDKIASAFGGSYASVNAANGISVTSPGAIGNFAITDSSGTIPVFGYTLGTAPVTAAVGQITPAQLTASIIGTPTKTYDGTTTATLGSGNYLISGLVGGQTISVNQPNTVGYASAEAGAETITAGFKDTNFIAGIGTLLSNYILPTAATGNGLINRANVVLSGILADSKVYDGNTLAGLDTSNQNLFGIIAGDIGNVTLTQGTGSFASANVGNNQVVSLNGFSLTGGKANDYNLILPGNLSASITPKALTIAGVTATSRTYDATTLDALGGAAALQGLVAGDGVSLDASSAIGNFASPNVGNGMAVTASGFALTGAGSGNYTLTQPTGLFANITPAPLIISLIGNPTKIYNGTTTADTTSANWQITGWQGGQGATLDQVSTANYSGPDAGNNIGVTATLEASDFHTASGTFMSNYTFAPTVNGTGTIAQAPLTIGIINNPTKVYDTNDTATLNAGNFQISGFLQGQGATVNQTAGTYADPNVGQWGVTALLTAANLIASGGTNLNNYSIPGIAIGTGQITPQPLDGHIIAGFVGASKTYDGLNTISLLPGNFSFSGLLNGDTVQTNFASLIGLFGSKNVGTQSLTANFSGGDLSVNSAHPEDYTLPAQAFGTGIINPAVLTARIIGNPTKTYDGSTQVSLGSGNYELDGFVAGEGGSITPSSHVAYASKDAGNWNIVAQLAVTSFTANSGTLFSNYILPTDAQGMGTINQAPLFITGVSAQNKVYDTTDLATLNVGGAQLQGLVAADVGDVTLNAPSTGHFATANAGSGIAVTPGVFSLSGSEAANYNLQALPSLFANITPAPLTLSGIGIDPSKIYDGSTLVNINGTAVLNGLLGGDAASVQLNASGAAANTRTANVGNNLAVLFGGYSLTGTLANNYALSQPGSSTINITPKQLTATIIGNPTKAYDGSTSTTLTAANYLLNGFVAGEGATVPQSATADYITQNAGTGITVNSTLVVSDFVAAAGTSLANYILPTTGTGTGTITKAIINLTSSRVYDGTAGADASLFAPAGTIAGVDGEIIKLTGSANLVDKNVGNQKAFNDFGTLALVDNGATLASNYTLVGGIDWVTVTPRALTATFGANDKTYDGNAIATLTGAALEAANGNRGLIGGDAVALGNTGTGSFSDKNAGTNKTVTGNMTISGGDAGNYIFTQGTSLADISQLHITVSATGHDKQYDGTTTAQVDLNSAGVVGGDTVNFNDGSANFADKNVASNIGIAVTGITATGGDAGNYVLDNTSAATQANITPREIHLTGSRVYDALTDADAVEFMSGGQLATGVAGETLVVTGAGSLADKNVGNGKAVSLGSLALTNGANGGLSSNYVLDDAKLTVTKANLNASFIADNKVYDGGTVATIHGVSLNGVLGSDDVDLNAIAAHFSDKNVGNGKTVTDSITVNGADAGNYNFTHTTATADITPLAITVTATGTNRAYNGLTHDDVTLGTTGLVGGDSLTFTAGASDFGDANVADGKTVTVTGITSSTPGASNYTFNTGTTTTANVTPFIINLHGTRVYDGLTDVNSSLFVTGGVLTGVNGETLTLNGNSNVADKNVANNKVFDGAGDMTLGGRNGSLSSNYAIGTSSMDITPLAITVGATGSNKVYDGNNLAGVTLAGAGILGGDTISFNDGSATYSDKNVANGKIITVSGITATGADANNYSFNTGATTTGNITPLAITGVITADNKVYDAGIGATTHGVLTGVLAGDTVGFDTSGQFGDKNVANGKTVTVSGALDGGDAGNYTFTSNTTTTANITPLAITVGIGADNKVYDGNNAAVINSLGSTGILAGDTVAFNGNPGTFSDKNVANGKTVTVDGISASGTDAGNYTFNNIATTTANITPLAITVAATGSNKVYDGNNLAGVTLGSTGVLAGDTVNFNDGSATYSDKNVANGKTITVNGIAAAGADAGNYTFNISTTTTGNITPLAITGVITADNKVYDAGIGATTHGVLTGVLAGDTVGFDTNGQFGDKNVANGKTVSVAGALNGGDAGNYTFTSNNSTTANITPLAITVGIGADNKVYDGNNAAVINSLGSTGILAGDTVGFSGDPGTFSDKNVANGKTVTVNDIVANGADAGNYTFNNVATTTADITPLAILVDITANNKVYDGNNSAVIASFGGTGVVAGDTVSFSGNPGTFSDKNVANGKTVTVDGITATGADAGNYTFNAIATTTANITPLAITVGAIANDKVYDGNTGAQATVSSGGVLGGDTVDFTAGSAAFGDKNVGNGKTVTVNGIAASGADAGNYTYNTGTTATANITPLAITGSIVAGDKVYDGNTGASVSGSLNGVIAGDQVGMASSGSFQDKNAGNGKTVNVAGTLNGGDAGNYLLTTNTTTTANITPVVLNLTGTRVYDGSTGAAASLFGNNGMLAGINGETLALSGSGTLGNKNVGSQKAFASGGLSGFSLAGNGGTLASNYTLAGGIDWVTVTPATLTVAGAVAHDRIYDGTRNAIVSGATLLGLFSGDDVVLGNAGSGLFDTKNVGNDKTVTTAMTVTGGDTGNYILVQPTSLVADITPKSINVNATGTDKLFDGNTGDKVTLGGEGVIAGDQIGFTNTGANFSDPAVGNGKTVTVTGIQANGADAANYVIADPTTTTTANITGGRPSSFGIDDGSLASLQYAVGPNAIETPYGVADEDTVGMFTGNQKKQHRPVERNRSRDDFTSGLALKVENGGVQMPRNQLP
jgi:filamentous hemagglutinin family protein